MQSILDLNFLHLNFHFQEREDPNVFKIIVFQDSRHIISKCISKRNWKKMLNTSPAMNFCFIHYEHQNFPSIKEQRSHLLLSYRSLVIFSHSQISKKSQSKHWQFQTFSKLFCTFIDVVVFLSTRIGVILKSLYLCCYTVWSQNGLIDKQVTVGNLPSNFYIK